MILEWVNRADLMRIKGVSNENWVAQAKEMKPAVSH